MSSPGACHLEYKDAVQGHPQATVRPSRHYLRTLAVMSAERGCGSADIMAGGVGGGGEGVPWPTGADGYKLDKIIGKGAFATVWKAFCATRGVHVAVKVMDLENVTHSFEDIRQEVGVLEYK